MSNMTALKTYLKLFEPYFAMSGVSEVCINKPHEIWVEVQNHFKRFDDPVLSMDFLLQFASLVGEYNQREIAPECPTLSAVLPDGARIQFVIEPACSKESFICAIRRQSIKEVSLQNYFKETKQIQQVQQSVTKTLLFDDDQKLLSLYDAKDYTAFLKQAVLAKKNIVVSGGTSTGKTTFLNALLQEIPQHERIITLETDREVKSTHPNTVHLLATEESKSVANITMLGLLKASLRLRPDRILVSEIRDDEAFPYLRAINSGHPGSITTLHADSPQGCFEQLAFMTLQSGYPLSRQELMDYAKSIINIIVQIKRDRRGKRFISEIYFDLAEKNIAKKRQPLFAKKRIAQSVLAEKTA